MTTEKKGDTTVSTLEVPGATLYYEVHGSGPVLLTISGGPTDAGMFTALAGLLKDRYTVVAYDQRGHSRSAIDDPATATVEVHADDAAALLDAMSSEPAYVLGSSGGATIGLELVARHGEKVKALVAHEPPVMMLLPDAARLRSVIEDTYDTFKTEGVFPAMEKFGKIVEEGGPSYAEAQQGGSDPAQAEMMGRMMGNFDLFMAHELRSIGLHVPDIDALKAAPSRVVVAGGKTSGEQAAYRSAVALADKLGLEITYFEGAHGGWGASDEAFAERVHEALQAS